MKLKTIRTNEHRLGVIGLQQSGKTVFTTSLIDHLRFHDPARFVLENDGARIRQFTDFCDKKKTDKKWSLFPYRKYRDRLSRVGEWPQKTQSRLQYICEFDRTDRKLWQRLKLYDFPGERIADTVMYGNSYEQWSDLMIRYLDDDITYHRKVAPFLDLQDSSQTSEEKVLEEYKRGLAKLALAFKPHISPSVFMLTEQGDSASSESVNTLIKQRRVGLQGEEFAPMGQDMREHHPEMAARFKGRYKKYQKQIVNPWVKGLRRCHSVAVLVDITMVLAGGVGMYDDNQFMIRKLLDAVGAGESILSATWKLPWRVCLPAGWRPGGIGRIAFVAAKSDKVLGSDLNTYKNLLKAMVERDARDVDGVDLGFFSCSAVQSTEVLDSSSRTLCGVLYGDSEKSKFTIPELPEDWPREWNGDDYVFPRVEPMIPPRKDCPPDHDNLDDVFEFLVG